jgi:sarcosine oxidase
MKRRDFLFKTSGVVAAGLSYSELYSQVQRDIALTPDQASFDVIVLGVGSMGSSACYHLARQGYKVLGLEQFDIPHEQGSHAGQSRIIRKAYGEDPDYVPLLERAYQNWKTLEEETQTQVYFRTGLFYSGGPKDEFLETVKESSAKYKVPVNQLSAAECSRKYPQFNLPAEFQRLEEPDAGLLTPERCILLMTEQAIKRGAVIRTKERVLEWKREGGTITVKTDRATYTAGKLVITAGPWAAKMMPTLASRLTVVRQVLAWMKPRKWEPFAMDKFPCWIIQDEHAEGYGFPILPVGKFGGPVGLKVALHQGASSAVDPDAVNRKTSDQDERALIDFMKKFIPDGYESTLTMKTCLYTNTPDYNFIIDYLPGHDKDVAVAAGFSGHGFKFVSVIGEIMADLAMKGSTSMPIGFLSARRFS